MDSPRRWSGIPSLILSSAFLLGAAFLYLRPQPSSARAHSSNAAWRPHVYIWQRAWTDAVRTAARTHGPAFARIVVLARQVTWNQSRSQTFRVDVDWETLRATGAEIAAAIRIQPFAGPFDDARFLADAIQSILGDAAEHSVQLTEIQIDFDCPTSKLSGYRQWLAAAKSAAGSIPVTITAIPTWLNSPAFADLARDAGYYVLQVHWLDRPTSLSAPLVLCDLAAARRAIEKAGRLQVRFRVALPTYGYVVAFNPEGSFAGLAAEDLPADWGPGKTLRLVEAQPAELATFVDQLSTNRPMNMAGIIWYRLPVEADRLNWSWTTLQSVMSGRVPEPGKIAVELTPTAPSLRDITLMNTGQQDADIATQISLTWERGTLVAADGLAGFQIGDQSEHSLSLSGSGGWNARLKPGERRAVGWLRLSDEQEVHAHVENPSRNAGHPLAGAPAAIDH